MSHDARDEQAPTEHDDEVFVDPSTDGPVIHEYDGIQECDNRLPRWWLLTFYGAIAFAGVYWIHYHTFGTGTLPAEELVAAKATERAAEAERIKSAGVVDNQSLRSLALDPGTVKQGQDVFASACVTCHGPQGAGNIGPNLTDNYWLHGSEPMDVYHIIRDGYLEKQMPAWGPQIGELQVRAATAFVLSIQGSNVPGKAPQGELVDQPASLKSVP